MKRKHVELLEKQVLLLEQLIRMQVLIGQQQQKEFCKILDELNSWHNDDTKYHRTTFEKLDAVAPKPVSEKPFFTR